MRKRYGSRPIKKKEAKYRVNEYIRAYQVSLIGENGEQLGTMSNLDALNLAREKQLDLVEVAPNVQPPVCKIMDYGKFQYQQAKQEKAHKSKQKKTETKGVRIGIRTDEHDLNFKKEQAEKFLNKGHKVKIEIVLRGREKAHQNLAVETMRNFVKNLTVPYKIEEDLKRFPGGFNMIITP